MDGEPKGVGARRNMAETNGRDALLTEGADAAPADRIFLRDHVTEIEIGAFADEFGVTQRLRFTVELDVRRRAKSAGDEVADIVSYDLITDAIAAVANGPRLKLLESFAERMTTHLFVDDRIERAVIRIEKLDRVTGTLGIEIERRPDRP